MGISVVIFQTLKLTMIQRSQFRFFPSMSNEDADDVISIVSDALTLAKR